VSDTLREKLGARLQQTGPIPFSEFMDAALYTPGAGFYRRPDVPLGREGHYQTSVTVGDLFGRLISERISLDWDEAGRPAGWSLCEQGAHDGTLLGDLGRALDQSDSGLGTRWQFMTVEPCAALREKQEVHLRQCGLGDRFRSFPEIGDIPEGDRRGVFLCNELVDSLPFEIVTFRGGEWQRRCVGWAEGRGHFEWVEVPLEEGPTRAEVERWNPPEIEGYTTEVHPRARQWIREVLSHWRSGAVLVSDYGYRSETYYALQRHEGTAQAFRFQRKSGDLLREPGEWDLTSHVNFDLLREEAEGMGWTVDVDLDQNHFLVGAARSRLMAEWEERLRERPGDEHVAKELRQFKTLTHPELMGRQFRVMVMRKFE